MAQLTGLSTAAVAGVIDRLEKVGLVRRVRDPLDRRKALAEILPMDEVRFAPLFQSVFDGLCGFSSGSPEERDANERFQNAQLDEFVTKFSVTPATDRFSASAAIMFPPCRNSGYPKPLAYSASATTQFGDGFEPAS
jgi:hypothetical protein